MFVMELTPNYSIPRCVVACVGGQKSNTDFHYYLEPAKTDRIVSSETLDYLMIVKIYRTKLRIESIKFDSSSETKNRYLSSLPILDH